MLGQIALLGPTTSHNVELVQEMVGFLQKGNVVFFQGDNNIVVK